MKKWCIEVTSENLPIVGKWFNENSQNGGNCFDTYVFKYLYLHYPILEDQTHSDRGIQDDYTELTFEQFKEQILKEPNLLQEILDKIKEKSYYFLDTKDLIIDFSDIEEIFSNYLNK